MKRLLSLFSMLALFGLVIQASTAYAVDPDAVQSASSNLARIAGQLAIAAEDKSCGMSGCNCEFHQLARAAERLEYAASDLNDYASTDCQHCHMIGKACEHMTQQYRQLFRPIQSASYQVTDIFYGNYNKFDYDLRNLYRRFRSAYSRLRSAVAGGCGGGCC